MIFVKIINIDTEKFLKSSITESSLQSFISQIDQKLTSSLFNALLTNMAWRQYILAALLPECRRGFSHTVTE